MWKPAPPPFRNFKKSLFQYEIDHMEGFITIDKVENPRQLILESDPDFYASAEFEEVM